ncbi:MAG: protein kinase [Proteobacteria bacterium]|nr:protein kinase [Pseudomonadota bacterium]
MPFTGSARFRLLDKLGEGGMGIVYDAYDQVREMRVALKTLRNIDALGLYRFKREFRALSDLSHPNIVDLYELVSDGDDWFLTMELVEGVDFISYVRDDSSEQSLSTAGTALVDTDTVTAATGGSLASKESGLLVQQTVRADAVSGVPSPPALRSDVNEVVRIDRLREAITQIARALYALHSVGIVHRDLKPSNVCVTGAGRAVLMDFGIVAEMRVPQDAQMRASIVGTPAFMAPEQIQGVPPSAAADWYALGVMLYLALTRRLPFEGSPHQVVAAKQELDPLPLNLFVTKVPEDLSHLCASLLQRDISRRATGTEVLAALGIATTDAAPAITSRPTAELDVFVGRTHELDELHHAYAAVRDGAARCVFVRGPSGMGKTSLIEQFLRQIRAEEPTTIIMSGRCHERESLAYKAFDGVIDDLSHFLLELPEAERKALLPGDVGAITRLFPALSRVPGCDGGKTFQGRNPVDLRSQAVSSLRTLLNELARDDPIVIRTEDLQWADRDSLDLLYSLLRDPAPQGLLVVGTIRSQEDSDGDQRLAELTSTFADQGILSWLTLGPLDGNEQRELMLKLANQNAALQAFDDQMWQEVAGHPMLLAELARYAQEAPDEFDRMSSLSLKSVVWQRVTGLSQTPRVLLHLIAVAGEPIPLRVLAEAGGLSNTNRERAWSVLRIARLARRITRLDRRLWVDSYHDKVREAIIDRLSADQLSSLHKTLARALEAWGGASSAALAHHWLAAGDRDRGVHYLVEAARGAADQLAFDRAAELYRSALSRMPEGAENGKTSPELETLRCRAWIGLAEGMRMSEQNDEALTLLERAEAVASSHGLSEERAAIHFLRGNLLFPTGDAQGCLDQHEYARRYAQKAGSLEYEIRALGGMGDAHLASGRMLSAFERFDACVELCRTHGFVGIEIANLPLRGWTRFYRNEVEAAVQDGAEGARGAARIGHKRAEVMARAWLGMILTEIGRLDEAREELHESVAIARTMGMQRFELPHMTLLGRAVALQGSRREAETLVLEAVERNRDSDLVFAGPMQFGALAFVTEDSEIFGRALGRGDELLDAGAPGYNYLLFYRDAMDAAFRFGDADRVDQYADKLAQFTDNEPMPWSQFFVAWGRSLAVYLRDKKAEDSVAELRRLHREAVDIGLRSAAAVLDRAIASSKSGQAA